ncbi:heparin lyase I family protein [Catenovulum maritimum]|uniref:Ig-like domain-containing protein n=1 Tax=Catenovulum maritimum TaxID=1513271 RepID=A0A0J8GLK6_9ALTE|nr:heparin lyase I family protein [Catenovulum maritimum]KMT63692.1 hypothetical protein XM47_18380 [Catenovulum maritimum]
MYKNIFTLSALTLALAACGGSGDSDQTIKDKENDQRGALSISGKASYGETLVVSINDPDGLSNVNSISYQWRRNAISIPGADSKSYLIQKADLNATLGVAVNYVDDKGFSSSLTAEQTTKVPLVNFGGVLNIEGIAKQGQTLEAILADDNGVKTSATTFIWFADGEAILNQHSSALTLKRAQVGTKITVQASYTDSHGYEETLTSTGTAAVAKIDNYQGVISITDSNGGSPEMKVGATLRASIDDLNTVTGTVEYFWYLDGDLISDQSQASYTLIEADKGKKVSVKAEYTDADGYAESVVFDSSDIITSSSVIPNGQDFAVGASLVGNDPIARNSAVTYETFAGGGWNSQSFLQTYHPGFDPSLPKFFLFTQFQGPHSFVAETDIVRLGNYSAKLHWKHENPEQWNGDPNKLDNTDRKAMFHGKTASSNSTTLWYGFSTYFSSEEFTLTGEQSALFFQLHGAKDKGEPSRIPPIALTVSSEGFKVGYSWDASALSTSTQGEGQLHVDVPVTLSKYRNRWVDFVLQVKTNPFEQKGFIKLWIDGKQMVNHHNIQLGYNDKTGLYPSYGWYIYGDNWNRDSDAIIYMDEFRQAEGENINYYDIAPGYFAN